MADTCDPDISNLAPTNDSIPECCCGRDDCVFLRHSLRLLEKVERDARTAGELGQVCAICFNICSITVFWVHLVSLISCVTFEYPNAYSADVYASNSNRENAARPR